MFSTTSQIHSAGFLCRYECICVEMYVNEALPSFYFFSSWTNCILQLLHFIQEINPTWSQLISYLTFCNKNSSSSSLFPTFSSLVYKQWRPLILCLTVFLDLKEISLAYRRKAVRVEKNSKIWGTNINLKTTPLPTSCWYLDMWQMDNYRKSFQKGGG